MSDKLISCERLRSSSSSEDQSILQVANSDRGRVIFSPSLRRLMLKTQVFALATDTVRNRLTHSSEVAHIGMYIVEEFFRKVAEEYKTPPENEQLNVWNSKGTDEKQAIRIFVEVACLVHDIGNPPFGHFGEKAIAAWFKAKHEAYSEKKNMKQDDSLGGESWERYAGNGDFLNFDGNMQGFRILTKLQRSLDDKFAMNLTCTQLASTIKYPMKNNKEKMSYFGSEENKKQAVWSALGLEENERHPLSLIMEAADDIAYCISDIEDAYDRGLVSKGDIEDAFSSKIAELRECKAKRLKVPVGEVQFTFSELYTSLRTNFTNQLVSDAAGKFIERIKAGTEKNTRPLLDDSDECLKSFREIASEKVYSSHVVLSNEVTGFAVLQGLLDRFEPLLRMEQGDFKKVAKALCRGDSLYIDGIDRITKKYTQEPAILSRIAKKHLAAYLDEVNEPEDQDEIYYRIHLIVDFISGMTDSFALKLYRLMTGQVIHETNT